MNLNIILDITSIIDIIIQCQERKKLQKSNSNGRVDMRLHGMIEEPHGRAADELAANTRQLAENKEWKPKDNYREIPTGIAELKEINNEPF